VVGLDLLRSDFYEKEISFQVSCSYGPGRYDEKYEQGGQDYPYGFVRWTEQRNFEAILAALQEKRLRVSELITDRFPIADAGAAYDKIASSSGSLGIILQYPGPVERSGVVRLKEAPSAAAGTAITRLKLSTSTRAKRILNIFLFTIIFSFCVYFYINRSFPIVLCNLCNRHHLLFANWTGTML